MFTRAMEPPYCVPTFCCFEVYLSGSLHTARNYIVQLPGASLRVDRGGGLTFGHSEGQAEGVGSKAKPHHMQHQGCIRTRPDRH